jgi:hypothetical protein
MAAAAAEGVTLEALRAVADLALAVDDGLSDLRSQIELEVIVVDPQLKTEIQRVLRLEGDVPPRVRAFRVVADHLKSARVGGGTRLSEADNSALANLLLRFAPVFREPVEEKPWRFTLKLAPSAGADLREAVADLARDGGSEKLLVRRPRRGPGPKARRVEELCFPARAQARTEKGKGKGRKGKGRGSGQDSGGGTGTGVGAEGGAPAASAAGEASGGAGIRTTYTGQQAPPAAQRQRR